jgi:Zn-dependent peptidase ImmA (M78 family)/DNA-binding XRE family transcriptional regulator
MMVSKAIIGERIRAARKLAGLSQQSLADKVKVSKMAISKYESGDLIPGSGMLLALGKALGVKVEFFLRPVSVTLRLPQYRCRKALTKKEEAMILGRTEDWLERYLTIERITGVDAELDLPGKDECSIMDCEDIEALALSVRKQWDLGLDPIENVMDVLEQHGIKVGVVAASEKFDALTLWYNHHPVIIVNKEMPGDRQRFSLSHELGHLLMQLESDLGTGAIPEKVDEMAANRFAGAFLVPEEVAIRELGRERTRLDLRELYLLKQKYGLSMAAWIYRALDLGIITRDGADRLRRELSIRGWRKIEPGKQIPSESPTQMRLLLLHARSEQIISESRFAELIGDDGIEGTDWILSGEVNTRAGEMCG